MDEQTNKRFPVLRSWNERKYQDLGVPRDVPWSAVAPHESQALENHNQTLQRLAERGGLDVRELAAVVTGKHWSDAPELEEAARIVRALAREDDSG